MLILTTISRAENVFWLEAWFKVFLTKMCSVWGVMGGICDLMFQSADFTLSHSSGLSDVRSQSGDEPCHWGLPVIKLWRQPGGPCCHGDRCGRYCLCVLCGPRVTAGQDEADVLGVPHLLGAGWPLRCESSLFSSVTLYSSFTAHFIARMTLTRDPCWFLCCVQSLRRVGKDTTVLLICVTVFLSYLPEAGQYSSFFIYLKQVTLRQVYQNFLLMISDRCE